MRTDPYLSQVDVFCSGALSTSQNQSVAAYLSVAYIFEVHYVYDLLHQLFVRILSTRLKYDIVYTKWPILHHEFLLLGRNWL